MTEEKKKNPAVWEYESTDPEKAGILKDALRIPVIDQCVKTFASDWEAVYGNKSIADL